MMTSDKHTQFEPFVYKLELRIRCNFQIDYQYISTN